jgi:hypothetical protein
LFLFAKEPFDLLGPSTEIVARHEKIAVLVLTNESARSITLGQRRSAIICWQTATVMGSIIKTSSSKIPIAPRHYRTERSTKFGSRSRSERLTKRGRSRPQRLLSETAPAHSRLPFC